MLQTIAVVLLFLSALAYLGWVIYRSFQSRSCATGCGKCSTLDVEKIVREVRSRENFLT